MGNKLRKLKESVTSSSSDTKENKENIDSKQNATAEANNQEVGIVCCSLMKMSTIP